MNEAEFSNELRRQARRGRITIEADEESDELRQAMSAYQEAVAAGDQVRVDMTRAQVERLLADSSESAPDFGAGARPERREPADMNTMMRRAARDGY